MEGARYSNQLVFPSIRHPSWPGEVWRPGLPHAFCEGIYPRGHGENMLTPHRKALSSIPLGVWALMTRRRRHTTSAHSFPLRELNPGPSSCEATALPSPPDLNNNTEQSERTYCRHAVIYNSKMATSADLQGKQLMYKLVWCTSDTQSL